MRRSVTVVAGFLESGKTTLINGLLENTKTKKKMAVVLCEQGIVKVDSAFSDVVTLEGFEGLGLDFFNNLVIKYPKHDFILEYNGTWPLTKLYQMRLPNGLIIDQVIYVLDATTASIYLANMPTLILEQINYSNLLYLTNHNEAEHPLDQRLTQTILTLNPEIRIISSWDNLNQRSRGSISIIRILKRTMELLGVLVIVYLAFRS